MVNKMINIKKWILCIGIAVCCSNVNAGSKLGPVGELFVQNPNQVFFTVGAINNKAFCQGATEEFAIDISTQVGKAQYATLLTAKALGADVQVSGLNDCLAWPDRESVNWLKML